MTNGGHDIGPDEPALSYLPTGARQMKGDIQNDPPEELTALFAAGALPPPEAAGVDTASAAREFAAVVAALTAAVTPSQPPPGSKERLLAMIDSRAADPRAADRSAAAGIPGLTIRFGGDVPFAPTPFPGVWARLLHVDRARRQFTAVLRLDPGASYPAHPHDGPEECLVLDGELMVGGVRLRAGDYQRAEPGSEHGEQRTETGAILFVTAPLRLLGG